MIKVLYKCACMKAEAEVEVAERRSDEDIADWMQNHVAMAISVDHRKRSALCMTTTMEYAKIFIPENTPGIGMKPKLDP